MKKSAEQNHLEDIEMNKIKQQDEDLQQYGEIDINDEKYNKKLNRRLDLRVLPLCCWVYLLNFLDRGMFPETCSCNKH